MIHMICNSILFLRHKMNRHNFLQFNPNCYKKHLSPLGQNVLDTLMRLWRTGFDNKDSERRHQFTSNQNRRNTREFNNSRSISSIPPSPVGGANYKRETYQANNFNFIADDQLIPETLMGQVFDSSKYINETTYENDIGQVTDLNNDDFAMPKIPVRIEPTSSKDQTNQENDVCWIKQTINNNFQPQHQGVQNMNVVLSDVEKQTGRYALCEVTNVYMPASSEHVKTVEITNANEEEILTANDMITPIINFDNINKSLLSSSKCINRTENSIIPPLKFTEIFDNGAEEEHVTRHEVIMDKDVGKVTEDVGWDNMFDTELIPEVKDTQILLLPFRDRGKFKIDFHKDKRKKPSISTKDNKVTKSKNQLKISNVIKKKVKKATCDTLSHDITSKRSCKKLKSTHTVKNWLNDVDPNNSVEDDRYPSKLTTMPSSNLKEDACGYTNAKTTITLCSDGGNRAGEQNTTIIIEAKMPDVEEMVGLVEINQPTSALDETALKLSTDIEKKPKTKGKKVVQARLAQKDGKMKYGPPAKEQSENTSETIEKETKSSKEACKEKKAKPKFTAPIKSLVPVKNITYDVNTVDESNLQFLHDGVEAHESEIVMILLYSNGFCQLNNNHTEDTCIPDSIMIQTQDTYYYIKDKQTSYPIRQLIEKHHVICYNGKQLLIHLLSKYGIELKQDTFNLFDAKIGGALIDPDNPPDNFAELQKLLGFTPQFTIATECVLQKAAWYTTLLRECFAKLKSSLIENSVWNIFVEIEMPLLPIIAGMEYRGVRVDVEKLKSMESILLTKMKAVEQECYKAAKKTFQINSALQVRTILYDELQLDTKSNLKIKETIGKGAKSTSEIMLRGLISVHPLPRLILEYRHLHKAHATFVAGIAQHVQGDGTVKPTWVQTAAATGRIASNNPNLQAIPKAPFGLVMFPHNSDNQEVQLSFRSVYVSRAQHRLVAADFQHIECRVFACAAGDAALLHALRTDRDLFKLLAAKWLNKPAEEVSAADRDRTKRIVYASLYGAGARKLMEILHIGYERALSVLSSFHRTFPALKSFGAEVAARARAGPLRTACGRARRFPRLRGADRAAQAHAQRQALNFVVQGSAADLCKKAMVEVQRRLERAPALRARLVLQIHDELVWEVADPDVDRAIEIIRETMENVGRGSGVPARLPVALRVARTWAATPAPVDSPVALMNKTQLL